MPTRSMPQSSLQSWGYHLLELPSFFTRTGRSASPGATVHILCGLVAGLFAVGAQAGAIYGVNHTHWAINHFSVDGHSAVDIIGPYQGGGGAWGYSPPAQWRPGMTVRVDWETGVAYDDNFPGFADWPKYLAWEKEIDAQKRQHTKLVPVPEYSGQKVCGITVHFLPCDQLLVTTSCYPYGAPEYPIKTPLQLPEPTACPK